MKPTVQISRQSRRSESPRALSHQVSKSPATDWSFQPGAELRSASAASTTQQNEMARARSLYAMSQGYFEAETKWADRVEAIGLSVVIAIAAWPIAQAIYIALDTV